MAVPEAMPVTIPVEISIDANMPEAFHVPIPALLHVVVDPAHTVVMPVIIGGIAPTVTVAVAAQPVLNA